MKKQLACSKIKVDLLEITCFHHAELADYKSHWSLILCSNVMLQ